MTVPPDISDEFVDGWVAMCQDLRIDPVDLIRVSYSESNIRASAHNIHGDASGLIQFMPPILANLGWTQGHAAFRELSAEQQLPYVRAYYAPHAAFCTSDALCYVACFLPALLHVAAKMGPDFVLCAQRGPLTWAYKANMGLDVDGDGRITVQDLADRLHKVCVGARYAAIVARIQAAMGQPAAEIPEPPVTLPDLAHLDDASLDAVDEAEDTAVQRSDALAQAAFDALAGKKD